MDILKVCPTPYTYSCVDGLRLNNVHIRGYASHFNDKILDLIANINCKQKNIKQEDYERFSSAFTNCKQFTNLTFNICAYVPIPEEIIDVYGYNDEHGDNYEDDIVDPLIDENIDSDIGSDLDYSSSDSY
jgi:hypothetical protein